MRAVTGLSRKSAEAIIDTHEVIECDDPEEAQALMAELQRLGASVRLATSSDATGHGDQLDVVVIVNVDRSRRAATIVAVQSATGQSREQAEAIIDTHEAIECFDEKEAESLMAELERLGATVELESSSADGGT